MSKILKQKRIIGFLVMLCLFVLIMPINVTATGLSEDTELILHYDGGKNTFRIYKIADFTVPDQYVVEEKFQPYVGNVTGMDRLKDLNTEEKKMLASTLRSLVITKGMEADCILETDEKGMLVWDNIPMALYLIVGDKTTDAEYVYTPMPILLSVPYEITEGAWENNVEIIHNKIEKKQKSISAQIPVVMVWRNKPPGDELPESVEVAIYKEDEPYDEEEFSEDNNWSYTWEDLTPDEEWNVEEDDDELPDGYTYSYVPEDDGIVIINTYEEETEPERDEKLPQTGQVWWPVPVLALWGCTFYIMGWAVNQKENSIK